MFNDLEQGRLISYELRIYPISVGLFKRYKNSDFKVFPCHMFLQILLQDINIIFLFFAIAYSRIIGGNDIIRLHFLS